MMIFAVNFSGIGAVSTIEAHTVQSYDNNIIRESCEAAQDATLLAMQLYGQKPEAEAYRKQLLTAYYESRDRDFVILFNVGGWGTKKLPDSADWTSIINGIQKDLTVAGRRVVTLNYQRTHDSLPGQLHELKEMIHGYPEKANSLAQLADFLTSHLPRITVILAGESTGTIICDNTMKLLKDNERVFSIQTGSPFWHKGIPAERTLLLNDNGIFPDSFSNGNIGEIVRSSLLSLIQLKKPEVKGEILGFISAPGHEYWWEAPGVSCQIERFLSSYFGIVPKT